MAYYRNSKSGYRVKNRYSGSSSLPQGSSIDMAAAFGGPVTKPTLSQYGLDGVNLERLKQEFNDFKAKQIKKKSKQDWLEILKGLFTVFCFSGPLILIVGVVSLFGANITSNSEEVPIYLIWGIAATAYLHHAFKSGVKKVEDAFPRKREWDNYQAYLKHCARYEEYQKSLKLQYWQRMDGLTFEEKVANLFKAKGYKTSLTRISGDGGIDIILSKDGKRYAAQCKAHSQKVSVGVARDLYGAMNAGGYDGGFLITTHGVTQPTLSWCNNLPGRPITILDASDLVKMSKSLSSDMRSEIPKEQAITTAEKGIKHVWLELSDEDIPF